MSKETENDGNYYWESGYIFRPFVWSINDRKSIELLKSRRFVGHLGGY